MSEGHLMIVKENPVASTLDAMISLGCVQEERMVLGNKIVMRTLPSSVLSNIAITCSGLDMTGRDRLMKIEILSRSIKSISGMQLIIEDAEDETHTKSERLEQIKRTIGKYEDPILALFWSEYLEL